FANLLIRAVVQSGSSSGGQTAELKLDDGTVESGALLDGLIIVNRLTPPSYPAKLEKVRLLFPSFQNQPDPTGKPITLLLLTDPGGSGQLPSNPQFTRLNLTVPGTSLTQFFDITIQNGPTITSGDFYIGYQTPTPAQGVGFALDTNSQNQNRTFASVNNGQSFDPFP